MLKAVDLRLVYPFLYILYTFLSQFFFPQGLLRPFTFSFEFCSENRLSGNFSISVPKMLCALSEWGGKLKGIQIESLLCAVGCPKPTIIWSMFHSSSWVQNDHLCLHRGVFRSSQIKWCSAHVRFSVCLCNFRCNEPANSCGATPKANREKEGIILVPVGHHPPTSCFSLLLCQYSLLWRWVEAQSTSPQSSVCHFPTGLIKDLKQCSV